MLRPGDGNRRACRTCGERLLDSHSSCGWKGLRNHSRRNRRPVPTYIHQLFPTQTLGMAQGRAASAPAASSADGTDGTRRQHALSRHDLRRGHARPAAAVRLDPEFRHSRGRLVGLRASAARRLGRAVRHVRHGVGRDLDRSRQRRAVHRLRGDLVGRARVRRPRAGADVSRRRRGALAARLPHAVRSPTRSTPRCCSAPASSPPTPGPRPTNSGAAAASRWCRAGRRSSCCSRMARCSCCARRSSQVLPWSPTSQVFDSVWLTVLSFEALLFTIAIAFILLAMAKERTELRHKTAALVDPLTGIANRRAFLEEVDRAEQAAASAKPARPRCCSPISTTSSRSTTASATPSATMCCRFSPRPPAPSSARTT